MIKKIIFSFLVLIFSIFINTESFAVTNTLIPVEEAFSDISKNYKYYFELQTLYYKGIIEPEADGKFHPDKLLKRDEFVAIAEETSCKKCIVPNTQKEFLDKYKEKPFFDVGLNNKYFYCISDAKSDEFVLGYKPGDFCKDGTQKKGEIPFCLNNNITLEEALAVVMRMGGIMTTKQADIITSGIEKGQNYPDLALDLKAKLSNGKANSFYPYFKKALEYEVIDYDANGKKKIYKLIEKKGFNLRPYNLITKQDFLKMAFIALKANSCLDDTENTKAIEIKVYDKSCNEAKQSKGLCKDSDLKDTENTFDFGEEVEGSCELGIDNKKGYIWRFYNLDTGSQIIKYGKFIDNYNFLIAGKYRVYLKVIDKCGDTGEVYITINIPGDIGIGLKVDPDKINLKIGSEVSFDGTVKGGVPPYKCNWDYGDGITKNNVGEDTKHIFKDKGKYRVSTICFDRNGLKAEAVNTISVYDDGDSGDKNKLGLKVVPDRVYGRSELEVNFDGTIKGGIKPYKCNWNYGDGITKENLEEDTKHIFKKKGTYKVSTICFDRNGLKAEAVNTISVYSNSGDLSVAIDANPIRGNSLLNVNLKGIVTGGVAPFRYIWDFADGSFGNTKNLIHIFTQEGVYEVKLTVIDKTDDLAEATVTIDVLSDKCSIDSDLDGVNDCDDKCPTIIGTTENEGCPEFLPPSEDPDNIVGECLKKQNNKSFIFGNVSCNSCPCTKSIDFRATIRECDTIIPAITSPTEKDIYSRGKVFQILK